MTPSSNPLTNHTSNTLTRQAPTFITENNEMSGEQQKKKGFFSRFKREAKASSLSAAGSVTAPSTASATVSGSENSAATSRNLQKASQQLEEYLRDLEQDDDKLRNIVSMSRNIEKAEAYFNSSFANYNLEEAQL